MLPRKKVKIDGVETPKKVQKIGWDKKTGKRIKKVEPKIDEEKEKEILEKRIQITLASAEGEQLGTTLDVPLKTTQKELEQIVNQLQGQEDSENLFSFYFDNFEVKTNLRDFTNKLTNFTTENTLNLTYHPQSLFFVRPITRMSSSIPGHTEAVLSAKFSPDSKQLASGSGDTTVRFWDVDVELPKKTSTGGHKNWVITIQWSPDGKKLASGDMNGDVCLWDPATGQQIGENMSGHKKWITSLSWEPLHINKKCNLLASSGKDATVRIWNTDNQKLLIVLSGHSKAITQVLWGGQNQIYTSSEDTTVKIWQKNGQLVKDLKAHSHWVNTLCLHTDFALRTGCYDEKGSQIESEDERQKIALERYNKLKGDKNERLVSGSDDFTLFLWDPFAGKKDSKRLLGHQQPINHAQFSPDGRFLISGSFDKSVRLWDGYTGLFITTFRGHVSPVYQIAFSPDSRLLVSSSKDSTLKVWDIKTKKLMFDLPGHADEVYTVDWSPDGQKVVSGGKDRVLKIWKN